MPAPQTRNTSRLLPITPDNITHCETAATDHEREQTTVFTNSVRNIESDSARIRDEYMRHALATLPPSATHEQIDEEASRFITAKREYVSSTYMIYARLRMRRAHLDAIAEFAAPTEYTPAEIEALAAAEVEAIVRSDEKNTKDMYASRAYENGVRWYSDDDEVYTRTCEARDDIGVSWWTSETEALTRARFLAARDEMRAAEWTRAAKIASADHHSALPHLRAEVARIGLTADSTPEDIDIAVVNHLAKTYPHWTDAQRHASTPLSTVRFTRAVAEMQAIRAAHKATADNVKSNPFRSNAAEAVVAEMGGSIQGPTPDKDSIPIFLPTNGTVTAIPLDDEGRPRPGAAVVMGAFNTIGLAADNERQERAKVELPKYLAGKVDELTTRPFEGDLPALTGTLNGAIVFTPGETSVDRINRTIDESLTTGPGELTNAERAYLDEVFLPKVHPTTKVGTSYPWAGGYEDDGNGFCGRAAKVALAVEERKAREAAMNADLPAVGPVEQWYWNVRSRLSELWADLASWLRFM